MATYKKYKLKNGKEKWLVKAYLGIDDITGKEVHITKRGFDTKPEAKKYYSDRQYEFDNNTEKTAKEITFEKVYRDWLKIYKRTVEESTYNKTINFFDRHLLPHLGAKRLDDIRPGDVQALVDHLHKTFKDYKKILIYAKKVYNYGREYYGITTKTAFRAIIYPSPRVGEKREIQFLEIDELKKILEAIKSENIPSWYAFFHLMAFTGIRRGEALALKWDDVDWKASTISINKNIAVGTDNKEYLKLSAKTDAGNRMIDLDANTLQVLKDWHSHKVRTISKENFIFPNAAGSWISLNKPLQRLKNICRRNKLPEITLHTFRHTHCSLLFEAGWSIKEVQARLGHSDIQTTMNIYTHVTNKQKEKSMKLFMDYLENA